MKAPQGITKVAGSCHCGDVRFEVEGDLAKASRCNCTICTKVAQVGLSVKPAAFQLLTDPEKLSSYEFGTKIGKRYFCKRCGVHCYGAGHLAELGGDFVSVNLNCVDEVDLGHLPIGHWDGRNNNWQSGQRPSPWPWASAS